jgi:hypothetical protein
VGLILLKAQQESFAIRPRSPVGIDLARNPGIDLVHPPLRLRERSKEAARWAGRTRASIIAANFRVWRIRVYTIPTMLQPHRDWKPRARLLP